MAEFRGKPRPIDDIFKSLLKQIDENPKKAVQIIYESLTRSYFRGIIHTRREYDKGDK